MINLYLFRGSNLNFTNILQNCFMLSKDNLYDPCIPIIKNDLLDWQLTEFINLGGDTPFRLVDWADHNEELKFLIDNNLSRAYATYRQDQIDYLKSYFKDKCFVTSFSYSSELYNFILDIFVRTHIHRQKCGIIKLSDHDKWLIDNKINLVEYYTQEFNQQQLVPLQMDGTGDYIIPIKDLFDQHIFFDHIKKIGATPNQQASDFYVDWLKSFEKIMKT